MKLTILLFLLFSFFLFFFQLRPVFAIENPAFPNNKFGVHILFTSELNTAANLVNTNGGDWGYVTIPIQTNDKDLEKWQKFMDEAKKLHIIPIIRLATEGDYFETSVWKKPSEEEVLDFANFLNSLDWPVKNRYVVIFNEVNRADEWGGSPNPKEYVSLLSYAVNVFKSTSEDFFIISAGLDNGSANDQYNYMIQMNRGMPGIFGQIDGLGSHSYPNPAFSIPPWVTTNKSISSFKFEKNLAYELSGKNLPVFITETGWSRERLSENLIASYFVYAFENVWSDQNIVAVTPFLLQAGVEPFSQFSLLTGDGDYNEISRALQKISKIKGKPTINYAVHISSDLSKKKNNIPLKTFSQKIQYDNSGEEKTKTITTFFKWLLKLSW